MRVANCEFTGILVGVSIRSVRELDFRLASGYNWMTSWVSSNEAVLTAVVSTPSLLNDECSHPLKDLPIKHLH